jgi:uncharacterized delta-60 repeat protein
MKTSTAVSVLVVLLSMILMLQQSAIGQSRVDFQDRGAELDAEYDSESSNRPARALVGQKQSFSDSVQAAWVSRYASGLVAGVDEATTICIDGSGNVYISGRSGGSGTNYDYATIKYNAAGGREWVARYDGPISGNDEPAAIAVDLPGNVYVTGSSQRSTSNRPFPHDYATIKYNSAGEQEWVARYEVGSAAAIAVDASGNVYVTGWNDHSFTYTDYVTIKYNSSGAQQWVARYDGPGHADDRATGIAVDTSGNIYVTGWSQSGSLIGTSDYATVKYNSSGVLQWVARYDGPGNSSDHAVALAVDGLGNVYVTGSSFGTNTVTDYATVKYSSAGAELWVARYDGPSHFYDYPTALAIDETGNVHVTGVSDGPSTGQGFFATVKYDPSGAQSWIARYIGSAHSDDRAAGIAVDALGNVYVAGTSADSIAGNRCTTIKYNSSGTREWIAWYDHSGSISSGATALAVDESGNVHVTGESYGQFANGEYATVKYNLSGMQQWVAQYDGPGGYRDKATALALDGAGNVLVTGSSYASATSQDYATVKYNPSGAQAWVARYNGPGNDIDEATALAADYSGNVYVTGRSWGLGTSYDYLTVKYNSSGVQQWIARYNGPGNNRDQATALAVDIAGNVYVTGASESLYGIPDYATVKYSPEGVQQWVSRNPYGSAIAIAVDGAHNVFVTGTGNMPNDYVTVKYNSGGVEEWLARYNGPGDLVDEAHTLAVDAAGNVYVTGSSQAGTSILSTDYATVKYNSSGVRQWVARYNGPANDIDEASALAVDVSGNVYVTGRSLGVSRIPDYATIKYSSSGMEEWVARYEGPGNSDDEATAVALNSAGEIYITGSSMGFVAAGDYVTVKYDAFGIQQWAARYNGSGNLSDLAAALAVDQAGNVFLTGTSIGYGGWSVYTTIKYVQTPVSVEEQRPSMTSSYWLAQNYPNPFNPSTTIQFILPHSSDVTLKVYDQLGAEIATLVTEQLPAGRHEVVWNADGAASGVYFCRLQAGGETITQKLLLVK